MRSMWKGTVTFGLVAIPVRLYAATENRNPTLHQVHVSDGSRIRHRRICVAEDREVPFEEIGRGFETADGRIAVLTDDDLAALPLPSAHTVEVLSFVPIESVDPIYFDRSYYLEPEKSAVKPFVMLRDAMNKAGRVAVTKIAIRQRETVALLRVYRDDLMVATMRWPDEVREPDFDFLSAEPPQVSAKEMTMASGLIDAMSEPVFEPTGYHDDYREALQAVVDRKIEGDETVQPPGETAGPDSDVASLVEALSRSIEASSTTKHPRSRSGTPRAKGATSSKKEKAKAKKPAARKTRTASARTTR